MSANKNKPYELRNISRIDKKHHTWNSENHAWQVRFLRKKQAISQWFEDHKFGNKEKALDAAKLYRDAMEKELGGQTHGKLEPEKYVTPDNLVGVSRRVRIVNYKTGPTDFPVWTACWTDANGKKARKAFAVSKYGEDGAQNLAIAARNAGTKEYFDKVDSQNIHKAFKPPENIKAKIWRYMDFTKFVSILQNQGLFLSRIDSLEDSFEGSFSKANKLLRPLIARHRAIDGEQCGKIVQELRKWIVVSCWHINEQESAAMWNLYSKSNEAICIQSTFDRLRNCLLDDIKIGTVQYINYDKEWIEQNDPILPFLYKRKSFEHEHELRAIKNLSNITSFSQSIPARKEIPDGIWHKLSLNKLIEKIYIAPQSPDWFHQLVLTETNNYKYSFPVVKSSLEEEPFF